LRNHVEIRVRVSFFEGRGNSVPSLIETWCLIESEPLLDVERAEF